MQAKSHLNKDRCFNPLADTCHAIGKLRGIGALLSGAKEAEADLYKLDWIGLSEIIMDAAEDIEYLIELSYGWDNPGQGVDNANI